MLIADYVALVKRPLIFFKESFFLRTGIRWNAEIKFENIQSVETIKRFSTDKNPGTLNASADGYPNIYLQLKEPVKVLGFYGMSRKVSKIVFRVDEPETFVKSIPLQVE